VPYFANWFYRAKVRVCRNKRTKRGLGLCADQLPQYSKPSAYDRTDRRAQYVRIGKTSGKSTYWQTSSDDIEQGRGVACLIRPVNWWSARSVGGPKRAETILITQRVGPDAAFGLNLARVPPDQRTSRRRGYE